MDLNLIRQERLSWLGWKDIKPMREALSTLPKLPQINYTLSDTLTIDALHVSNEDKDTIKNCALSLMPWRKGPFDVCDTFIDNEWQSFIKYNLLEPHFNLEGKIVGDIGCNNGYYLFRMLSQKPKKLIGFDPSALYKTQFDFIQPFYPKWHCVWTFRRWTSPFLWTQVWYALLFGCFIPQKWPL